MNLVTLINESTLTLASGKLVFSAEETSALKSAIDAAQSLVEVHTSAAQRVADAAVAGQQQGYSEGYEAGLQEGRRQISAELVRLAKQAQIQLDQQRNQSTQMALHIVRKVAGQFETDQTLAALASEAAQDCGLNESITLRVHPQHTESVRQRLQALQIAQDSRAQLTAVVEDATLNETGCVLETRHGSVIADLETQLLAIQQNLEEQVRG